MRDVNLPVLHFALAILWGVEGYTTDPRNVMATVHLDGVLHHVEHYAPYTFPGDNGLTATIGRFGTGSHTVEFVFYLEGTTTEIGRANVRSEERRVGAASRPRAKRNLNLKGEGLPTTGPW